MSAHDPLLLAVSAAITRVTHDRAVPANVGPDTPLGDGFWLDSVDLLEVLVACEVEFSVVLDEGPGLESGALDTLGQLTAWIRAKQTTAKAQA